MINRGINTHRFCEGIGIRVMRTRHAREPRPPNVIYGGRIIARMLRRAGPDHTGLVLMCIKASDPACFYGDAIIAVSQFIKVHGTALGGRQVVVQAFARLDLGQLRNRAQRLARADSAAMTKTSAALAVMIAHTILGEEAA
ncbi:hypothetical protein [Aquamicrobium sp. LC103]|uniref:hypothetical protein n=1 Tax=Aquamicrobium sp. LC103 TaxID=1120658 RepID=UPI00063E82F1|nr:hypothetical protein [Aquamicrobium sp. LC103]TKT78404.1 hypothetical protein XW59_012370 [Aquamicrobium sp. LC103]